MKHLNELTTAGYRERLIARGLARGLIWQDGKLPPESPPFSEELTTDLLDHGFAVLELSLDLRPLEKAHLRFKTDFVRLLNYESAIRRGEGADIERGFHLTMAAAAFHIGGYTARAFTLFEGDIRELNLASYERSLVFLMRRNFDQLRENTAAWLQNVGNSDEGVAERLTSEEGFSVDDAIAIALTRMFHQAMASFEVGLLTGRQEHIGFAKKELRSGSESQQMQATFHCGGDLQ